MFLKFQLFMFFFLMCRTLKAQSNAIENVNIQHTQVNLNGN